MARAELWCRLTVVDADGRVRWDRVLRRPGRPDLAVVDRLARVALAARRRGGSLRLSEVTPALADLLELAGLAGVAGLPEMVGPAGSGVEVERQPEAREQALGVEQGQEEVHGPDLPA